MNKKMAVFILIFPLILVFSGCNEKDPRIDAVKNFDAKYYDFPKEVSCGEAFDVISETPVKWKVKQLPLSHEDYKTHHLVEAKLIFDNKIAIISFIAKDDGSEILLYCRDTVLQEGTLKLEDCILVMAILAEQYYKNIGKELPKMPGIIKKEELK